MLWELPIQRITAEHGTPVLILSERMLNAQVDAFVEAAARHLPPHRIYYSMKTNDVAQVVAHLARRLDGLECVSESEVDAALACGVDGRRLVLNGPNKTTRELELAVTRGAHLINLDGLDDARRLLAVAEAQARDVRAGIRLAFDDDDTWQKFGVSPDGDEMAAMVELIDRSPRIHLTALHYHGDPFRPDLLERLEAIRRRLSVKTIDLGGGYEPVIEIGEGGRWQRDERTEALFARIGELWRSDPPDLILEPGRALVEGCLVAVAQVGNVKRDRGQTYVYVDLTTGYVGGRHPCDRRVKFLLGERGEPRERCVVAGPMCYGSDVLGEADIARPREGRVMVMANAGAYTLTLRWHGPAPAPAIVWVDARGDHVAVPYEA